MGCLSAIVWILLLGIPQFIGFICGIVGLCTARDVYAKSEALSGLLMCITSPFLWFIAVRKSY